MTRTIQGGKRRQGGKSSSIAVGDRQALARPRVRAPRGAERRVPVAWWGSFVDETIERLGRFRSLARQCAKKPVRGAVHRLRIEARRLLARFAVLSSLLPPDVLAKGRRAVKKQLQASRSLRDAQVQRRRVRTLLSDHPELDAFARHLKRREGRVVRAARERIGRPKQLRRLVRLQQALEACPRFEPATERDGEAAARLVWRRARARMRKAAHASGGDTASLHRLRIAVKACHYLAEGLQSLRPGISAASLEMLRAQQARLGRVHDRALLQARLGKFVQRHEPALRKRKSREVLRR